MTDGEMRFQLAVWAVSPSLPSLPTVPLGQCPHFGLLFGPVLCIPYPPLDQQHHFKQTRLVLSWVKLNVELFALGIKQPQTPSIPGQQRRLFSQEICSWKPQGS